MLGCNLSTPTIIFVHHVSSALDIFNIVEGIARSTTSVDKNPRYSGTDYSGTI